MTEVLLLQGRRETSSKKQRKFISRQIIHFSFPSLGHSNLERITGAFSTDRDTRGLLMSTATRGRRDVTDCLIA